LSVLPDFDHYRPTTLQEALEIVSFRKQPYAGGTELLLAMRAGILHPHGLVDLKRIPDLRAIEVHGNWIEIGGAVTHQEAIDDPRVRTAAPALVDMLGGVGNPRVRSAGTLGGNLCFAEPKSDVGTLLNALEATVELRSKHGVRSVAVSDFTIGPYETVRRDDELMTTIRVPERLGRSAVYAKYQTMERPTLGVAAAITSEKTCRLVIGAVGGTPQAFEGAKLTDLSPGDISRSVEVIPDMTGSERYKRHIVAVYIEKVLRDLQRSI
jgi:carbon-monoxide dehydrogenase medium subunit